MHTDTPRNEHTPVDDALPSTTPGQKQKEDSVHDLCALEYREGEGDLGTKPRTPQSSEPQAQSRLPNICFQSGLASVPFAARFTLQRRLSRTNGEGRQVTRFRYEQSQVGHGPEWTRAR